MAALLVLAAAASAYDLHRVETHTLVIYSTPALRDVLEQVVIPEFRKATGHHVEGIYELSAGEEYNRVRLSKDRPEADLFLHASPLFMERGRAATPRYFDTLPDIQQQIPQSQRMNLTGTDAEGLYWFTFAWSPLVEVWPANVAQQPDLATTNLRFGMPHPRLSNNGVYTTAFFEALDPAAGQRALRLTVVQPTSARTTVGGVADGNFDVTLGYEAVARLYQSKGARIHFDVPLLNGARVTTPVLFCAGLITNHPHPGANEFAQFLLSPQVQERLHTVHVRPVVNATTLQNGVHLDGVRSVTIDWRQWQQLDASLSKYEVNR